MCHGVLGGADELMLGDHGVGTSWPTSRWTYCKPTSRRTSVMKGLQTGEDWALQFNPLISSVGLAASLPPLLAHVAGEGVLESSSSGSAAYSTSRSTLAVSEDWICVEYAPRPKDWSRLSGPILGTVAAVP